MELAKETTDLISELKLNFEVIKNKQIKDKELDGLHLWWDNPNLIFVLITDEEEDYEGSQAQIGIAKDGSIRWEYQSHCSCNGYEDSNDEGKEFLLELTKKSYELNSIPLDWEEQIRKNILKLLS